MTEPAKDPPLCLYCGGHQRVVRKPVALVVAVLLTVSIVLEKLVPVRSWRHVLRFVANPPDWAYKRCPHCVNRA